MAIRVVWSGSSGGAVFHAPLIDTTAALSLDAIVTTHPSASLAHASDTPRRACCRTSTRSCRPPTSSTSSS